MKQLLTILLVFFTSISFVFGQKWPPTLEDVLKDPMKQTLGRGVQYREEFPVLFIDSVYSESRDFETNEISNISYERYRYNTDDKLIQLDYKSTLPPDFLGSWTRIIYELNAVGNEISSLTISDDNGIITLQGKSTSTYNNSNKIVERIGYYWAGFWDLTTKAIYEYPNALTTIRTEQIMEGGIWVNLSRNTRVVNNEGLMTNETYESWDVAFNGWMKQSESMLEYDTNGNLIVSQSQYGDPVQFGFKAMYHYDAQGRNDYSTTYNWSTILNDWEKTGLSNNIFNSENQIIERLNYDIDALGTQTLGSKDMLTYNEGIFSTVFEEQLNRIWDLPSQVFLDNTKIILDFMEIPNNKTYLLFEYKIKTPPGSPNWNTTSRSELFYHIDTDVSAPAPPTLQPCQAPNPYPTNHRVTCDGLQENGSYMLYVYDTQGRMAYARHFKGGDGWSIHQNLPTGVYIAASVRNGERISSQRLVIGR